MNRKKQTPSFTFYDLLDACREPGCPVCRLEQRHEERYLDSQFYENVNSPGFRAKLRASMGFCREHAWLAVSQGLGDALGFAIIYQDVITNTLRRLKKNSPAPAQRWRILPPRIPEQVRTKFEQAIAALTPQRKCPACQNRDEMLEIIISSLAGNLGMQELKSALDVSDGLCLPHLRSALQAVKDERSYEQLITMHVNKLETLHAELTELIRKNDYRFKDEGIGKEGTSWLRAIAMLAGNKRK